MAVLFVLGEKRACWRPGIFLNAPAYFYYRAVRKMETAITVGGCFYGLGMLICLLAGGKPVRIFLLNAGLGIWMFALINLTSFLTGVRIPVNPAGALCSALGGLPGTVLLLLFRYWLFPG